MRGHDTWRVTAEVDAREAESAEYLLAELGAQGSQEEDADRPSMRRISAYFDSGSFERENLRDRVAESFSRFPLLRDSWIEVDLEPARDWNERWREFFKPFALADSLIVVPSWEDYRPGPGERTIHIDPGMAFGTGLHETTRLCAEALISEIRSLGSTPPSLIDVGTGSGILAIVARKLGAGRIAAVEIDPQALEVARDNFGKNDCGDIELDDDIERIAGSFDVTCANILLSTLIDLEGMIAGRTRPGGVAILSGITNEQEEDIAEAYARDFVPKETTRRGEWIAMTMMRRG